MSTYSPFSWWWVDETLSQLPQADLKGHPLQIQGLWASNPAISAEVASEREERENPTQLSRSRHHSMCVHGTVCATVIAQLHTQCVQPWLIYCVASCSGTVERLGLRRCLKKRRSKSRLSDWGIILCLEAGHVVLNPKWTCLGGCHWTRELSPWLIHTNKCLTHFSPLGGRSLRIRHDSWNHLLTQDYLKVSRGRPGITHNTAFSGVMHMCTQLLMRW